MKEVEVKVLEVNRAEVEEILLKLGAQKVFDGEITTLFFDFNDDKISNRKDVLRLRKEKDKVELTYKKVRFTTDAKTAEEYSVEVSCFEEMKRILENIGLSPNDRMQKHRVSYTFEGARFDFDCYSGIYEYIPEFLEIEAKNADLIRKYAALLGFKEKDCLPWSTKDLIKKYGKNRVQSKQR